MHKYTKNTVNIIQMGSRPQNGLHPSWISNRRLFHSRSERERKQKQKYFWINYFVQVRKCQVSPITNNIGTGTWYRYLLNFVPITWFSLIPRLHKGVDLQHVSQTCRLPADHDSSVRFSTLRSLSDKEFQSTTEAITFTESLKS